MRRGLVLAGIALIATAAALTFGQRDSADFALSVEVQTYDGSPATLAGFTGRPLVVNFWASWCPSCVAELTSAFVPAQNARGDQVDFIGVNLRDEMTSASALVAETGVQFELLVDTTGELYAALGGIAMPFTVLIDADGNVVDRHNGPLSERILLDKIDTHLLP